MKKIINFIKEARGELLKVDWPTRNQTLNYTILVVAVSLIVAAFLGGLDYLFGVILKKFLI